MGQWFQLNIISNIDYIIIFVSIFIFMFIYVYSDTMIECIFIYIFYLDHEEDHC